MPLTVQVTFDCADPAALASFWCLALGYELDPPPAPFTTWPDALTAWGIPETEWNSRSGCSDPEGTGPHLWFQQVPEGKTAKNRLHLDLRAAPGLRGDERMAALAARAEELQAAGATILKRFEPSGIEAGWIVMADPEGNEFCLD